MVSNSGLQHCALSSSSRNRIGSGHGLFVCIGADQYALLSAAEVREGLDVHFAETYEDVYQVAFEYDSEDAAQKVVPHSEQRLTESAAAG